MSTEFPSVSVIISVYDNTEFLKAVLDSLKLQTWKDFEIIISEDAQHAHMDAFIREYRFENPYKHLTQADEGWQKNKALNRAILEATGDYLIFVDGDNVLHPRFVEMHLKLASPHKIIAGKRIKLNQAESEYLLSNPSHVWNMNRKIFRMLITGNKKGCGFVEEGLYISPESIFGFVPRMRTMYQLKGCNMSMYKNAIIAINGFDEDFTQPAVGEDIDLVWRFEGLGYRLKSARNLAVQYHLNHAPGWTDQSENLKLMESHQEQGLFVCKNGIRRYNLTK